jgi:hypothetical protein
VAAFCLLTSLGAMASLPRAAGDAVPRAIVFPPWMAAAEAVSLSLATGHRVLRSGRLASIVVVAPADPAGASPPLPQGAWFSLVLAGLAGCLDATDGTGAAR